MATELVFTVWTSGTIGADAAQTVARNLLRSVRASGDTEAQVVAIDITSVEPRDIDALEIEANRQAIVEALEADIEPPEELIGESGYPVADEGDHVWTGEELAELDASVADDPDVG